MSTRPFHQWVLVRLVLSAVAGLVTAAGLVGSWHVEAAAVSGWIVTAAGDCLWTWLIIRRLDASGTRMHATVEDPGRGATDVVLLVASVASLAGVGVLLAATAQQGGSAIAEAGLGVLCVAASWFLVHLVHVVRYARLYYGGDGPPGGVDFNQDDDPDYRDFAYLSFTLGMTYQVSDTAITDRAVRHLVLRHTLLSYLLGAVVLASTVNMVVAIASTTGR